jgi:glycosyltransferase involved in cell wall biosynthesis
MSAHPLRILHVTPYYEHAWAYGGIPRVVAALAKGLAALGHTVTVCTTDACSREERLPIGTSESNRAPGEPAVVVQVFRNLSNALAYDLQFFLPIGLATYLRKHTADFDIVHVHACHNIPGTLAAGSCRRARVPYVLTPNGTAPRIERRQLAKLIFDATIGRRVLSDAARLLAVSDAECKQFRELNVADGRMAVIPNPLDLSEFSMPLARGTFRQRTNLGDRPVVMFLGKLTPRKRLDVLARAFSMLPQPNATLVIVGNDMGYKMELDRLIEQLAIGPRVVQTGLVSGRARLEALIDADVVVYPSKDEIFGLVPIEALMCGTPVIVADDSGCGEVINRVGGGLIVPQGDAGALAGAIGRVLDANAQWRETANTAAIRVKELYAARAVCEQLEAVYRQVIADAPAAR